MSKSSDVTENKINEDTQEKTEAMDIGDAFNLEDSDEFDYILASEDGYTLVEKV